MLTTQQIDEQSQKIIKEIDNARQKKLAELKKQEILLNYQGNDEVISFDEIVDEIKNEQPQPHYKTKYPSLDKSFGGGFIEGDLVLVTGFSGQGKTSLCFDMTRNMESSNCLWLPFEESAEELARKAIRFNSKMPKFYTPRNLIKEDLTWIEERILESVLKYDTKVVFLDNLHFITMANSNEESWNKAGNTAKTLKKIAKKLGIVIVLIVHLRKTLGGISKAPTYDDISGSSDVIKVSDKCLILWRESKRNTEGLIEYTGNNIVSIAKNRQHGILENYTYSWNKGVFTEVSADQLSQELSNKIDYAKYD